MGKVLAARTRGERIPDNWVVDADGVPTTDLSRIPNYPNEGALLPMAGHKGYGLAMLVEVLSAVLTGARVTDELAAWWKTDSKEPIDQGHAFIVLNVGAMMPAETFAGRLDRLIEYVKSSPKAANAGEILLPGEREWRTRTQALAEGIALPMDVLINHEALAKQLRMDFNLCEEEHHDKT
jgi:LDH2 family malate/lactate/ureidoglycolate dehydrogenase